MSALLLTKIAQACGAVPTGVTADSRQVRPGMVFVAVAGAKGDGVQFIEDAFARGAVAVIRDARDSRITHHASRVTIPVDNPRLALSQLAAAFYPRQPEHIAAVTGTDGKTSTADFTRQLWALMGKKAASIGTLGTIGEHGQTLYPGQHTTPDPVALHRMLQELADAGYTHVAMEASSHGLHQHRLDGVRVRAAAFTNLTRDHLDYHGNEQAYFAAKARLFADFPLEAAVLNADDARFAALERMVRQKHIRVISYGRAGEALRLLSAVPHPGGQRVELRVFDKVHCIDVPHVGAFQVYNMLAAAGLVLSEGEYSAEAVAQLFPQLHGVPGRMERVAEGAYIDYAHTPAALANVLKVMRVHTPKRLIVVFGCGGERDKGKRPQMGAAAADLADVVIVTDDNPRGEDPAVIRAEVLAGAPKAKEIADRRAAIYAAARMLEPGDVLLAAGKGHEKTQIIGGVSHPFDDAEVIREAMHAVER